ncbi:MAG: OmpA family protein [Desulfuromonadaceae bacterium]|nr:OmpA family protein [Desulfuromonadaceae bacterium]
MPQKNPTSLKARALEDTFLTPHNLTTAALLLCSIVILLLSGCVSKQTYDQQLHQSETLSSKVDAMSATIAGLKDELSTTRANLADCRAELEQNSIEFEANKQRQSSIYKAREQKTEGELTALQADTLRLKNEKATLLESIEENQDKIAALEKEKQKLGHELEREKIAREARIAQMSSTYNELVGSLEQELARGELTIKQLKNKLSVNLVGQILFASGTANLTDDGKRVLRQVGDSLKKISNKRICVEGHTDNLPIKQSMQEIFPSNWELAAARAANVVHFLQDEIGIDGKNLEIRAMGHYQPVANNNTAEGRAQNRRIEIVLVDLE